MEGKRGKLKVQVVIITSNEKPFGVKYPANIEIDCHRQIIRTFSNDDGSKKEKKSYQNKHLVTCDYFSTVPSCLHFIMFQNKLKLDFLCSALL